MAIPLLTNKNKYYMLLIVVVIAISLFMSFSKILLLFLLSYFIFIVLYFVQTSDHKKYKLIYFYSLLFFGISLYLVATNILIVERGDASATCKYGDEITILRKHVPNEIKLCPSFFVHQKIKYMKIGADSFPWGIGASNKISNQSKPHNTYFERYALHGAVGIVSLILIIHLVTSLLLNIRRGNMVSDYAYIALLLFWIMNLIIALNDDILRFRELWVMIAVTMGITASNKVYDKVH